MLLIAHLGLEVPQHDYGVSGRPNIQSPSQGLTAWMSIRRKAFSLTCGSWRKISHCFTKKVKLLLCPLRKKLTPSHLSAESTFLNTNVCFRSLQEQWLLPLSAVFVAQLAHFDRIRVLPHQRVVLSQHALGTSRHAEQPILEVGTLCTVCRALDGCRERLVMFTTLLRRGGVYVNCTVSL